MCFELLLRDHKTEMARKKIATTHFLPETYPLEAIVFQIIEVERGRESRAPYGLRSQCQNYWANLHEKKRCSSHSSPLKQLWYLEAMDHPLDLAQLSIGVFLCIRHQIRQDIRVEMNLFQIRLDQQGSTALVLNRFQAFPREDFPEEFPC